MSSLTETNVLRDADAEVVVAHLGLQRHPEGGWYKETWRGASETNGKRGIGTAILYLLAVGERSHWHRVDATELWLYHAGAPFVYLPQNRAAHARRSSGG